MNLSFASYISHESHVPLSYLTPLKYQGNVKKNHETSHYAIFSIILLGEISGSHGGEYEDDCLL
jgi:hypothetical protein